MISYKILSLLLSYPSTELQLFLPEAATEISAEKLIDKQMTDGVRTFTDHYSRYDLMEWQAEYVQLFDTGRAVSLYLFEHLKGDSRERGQAMVDLIAEYNRHGMYLTSNELPDYLPLFLEFLSSLTVTEAAETLAGVVSVVGLIEQQLTAADNIYRHILKAVVSLSALPPSIPAGAVPNPESQPYDPDRDYDKPVSFGNDNPCITCK